jgi:predicted nucleotidyltransferase
MGNIFKTNNYRTLELFIEFPTKNFSIRGIARDLKLSHAIIIKHIEKLLKLDLIRKNTETLYPTYYANTENKKYKFYKKNYLIDKLMESKIVEYIQEQVLPSSIILFGSGAKATFTEKSDLDIFVEAKESKINMSKYEKKLGRKVNLLFEPSINKLSKELRNNIINGFVLYGFIKVNNNG